MGPWGRAGVEAWDRDLKELGAHEMKEIVSAAPGALGSHLPEPMGGPSLTERVDDLATRRVENAVWRLMQKQGKSVDYEGYKQEYILLLAKQTIGRQLDFARASSHSSLAEPLGGPVLSRRMRTLCADIDRRRLQNALWRLGLQRQSAHGLVFEQSVSSAKEAIGLQIDFQKLRQMKLKQALLGLPGFAIALPLSEAGDSTAEPTARSYMSDSSSKHVDGAFSRDALKAARWPDRQVEKKSFVTPIAVGAAAALLGFGLFRRAASRGGSK